MATDMDVRNEIDQQIDRILKSLFAEDPLGVVIRGHLYVESRLIQLIEEALPDPGAIDLTRLNFPIKLDLAVALQLLSENQKRAYAALNALRNRVAHNADVQLLPTDESWIYKALNEHQRRIADSNLEHFSKTSQTYPRLKASIFSLCIESMSLSLLGIGRAKKAAAIAAIALEAASDEKNKPE